MPTANLSIDNLKQQIEYGVYACYVYHNEKRYIGVCNVGNRPTVDNRTTIEVHILDFNLNIYDEELVIELTDYLRPIYKFASLEDVKNQVDKDIIKTRELLSA